MKQNKRTVRAHIINRELWFMYRHPRSKVPKSKYTYKQEDINAVDFNIDLVTVISDFTELSKRGKDYIGECPFCKCGKHAGQKHFRVSRIKKVYKCYNCGQSGRRSTQFITQFFETSFENALEYLNRKYTKINLIRTLKDKRRVPKRIVDLNSDLPF
jgi:DNA primase